MTSPLPFLSKQVATGSGCRLDSTPTSNENDVLCMGEVLIDFVATESNVDLFDVNKFTVAAGGAPANVAVGVRRLGLSSGFVGKVGNDPFGVKLRNTLAKAGVDTKYLLVVKQDKAGQENNTSESETRTTIVFGSVWDDGHKDLCFYRGADRCLLPEEITLRVLEGAKCLHYGSIIFLDEPAASAQHKAIRMARERGLMITYDPNYRPTLSPNEETAHRVIMSGFKYAHLAKISQEEWHVATGHKDLQCGIQAVLNQGVELVVISRGEQGALATNGDYVVESPALANLNIVETTGAGDAFMAAMISRLLPEFYKHGGSLKHIEKGTIQAALDFANVVGGLACTKAGAIPALPTTQEVDRFLASRRRQADPSLDGLTISSHALAKMIDHTFLRPYCETTDEIEKLCREARQYGFAIVAVNPAQVDECCQLLRDSDVRVGAAIGFPLGQTTSATKMYEARDAIQRGATEIDMVLNVRDLQTRNYASIRAEVQGLVEICHSSRVFCKIILETCYLTSEEIVKGCEICRDARVDFVKTSTGFGPAGANVEDVKLMRETVGTAVGVKAAGGIRALKTVRALIAAGANRIGTSSGVSIMEELLAEQRLENEKG